MGLIANMTMKRSQRALKTHQRQMEQYMEDMKPYRDIVARYHQGKMIFQESFPFIKQGVKIEFADQSFLFERLKRQGTLPLIEALHQRFLLEEISLAEAELLSDGVLAVKTIMKPVEGFYCFSSVVLWEKKYGAWYYASSNEGITFYDHYPLKDFQLHFMGICGDVETIRKFDYQEDIFFKITGKEDTSSFYEQQHRSKRPYNPQGKEINNEIQLKFALAQTILSNPNKSVEEVTAQLLLTYDTSNICYSVEDLLYKVKQYQPLLK